ncbi:hypothetical protein IAQ61_005148 [Plenodomus lingam]|uniref:RNase H type-1 domain-containing protein n=1 Tax=Leptosphaeria maculans (strain JN3 / isolate v23.1.3 / race Av1-4-5-6-7-8) TaxID=985895 RepID=E5A7K6_LEPMJ|nr:hypothetical protein LEMA_P088400.1 [Plenodomus lingam JN3]KAH9872313.1 hypothetical protein IAQ61_005148 [Plenodomus lingam]CBX99601.1 hypothetical protein LEMA_P088400.1 [Plenodomus lingam JN3]
MTGNSSSSNASRSKKWRERTRRLENDSQIRINNIIGTTIGWERSYDGKVLIGESSVVGKMNDAAHLKDIKGLMEADLAAVYWCDGGEKRGSKETGFKDALGAGVVWMEERVWREKAYPLGKDTGDSMDAEVFGLAAALRLAQDTADEKPWLRVVRIFSDGRRVLEGLRDGYIRSLGPAVSSPWALTQVYNVTRALVRRGITVELVWVKGHAGSEGNYRADLAARNGWSMEARQVEEKGWVKMSKVPAQVAQMGSDAREEWYWRVNKAGLRDGKEKSDDDQRGRNMGAPSLLSSDPVPHGNGDDEDDEDDEDGNGSIDMDISDEDE